MAGRVIAVVVAALLIAAGFAVRSWTSEPGGRTGDALQLTCVSELKDVCERVAKDENVKITVEPASKTLEALSNDSASASVDGWLAPPAWIEMARNAQTKKLSAPMLSTSSKVVGRTPVVVVIEKSRANVMRSACSGDITWACVNKVMGTQAWSSLPGGRSDWGSVKVGWPDPGTTASGLAVLGSSTVGYFGRTDVDAFDLDDGAYGQSLTAASRSLVRNTSDPLTTMVTAGPATFAMVATTESAAAPLLATAARASEFELVYPSPHTTLDVSLATVGDQGRLQRIIDKQANDALVESSWRLPGAPTTKVLRNGVGMPSNDGEPSAGTLESLRGKWQRELGR